MTMQKYPLAMVYAVKQCFRGTYDPGVALSNGTVFEELNKPFYPIGCKNNGREGCL
ncbi:MAG: spore coat associated protein CotJA [Clostridia bacterium]|nr:spore coat associated protein CotJA [Clostridia bacterium]